jgi:hypothetical protein
MPEAQRADSSKGKGVKERRSAVNRYGIGTTDARDKRNRGIPGNEESNPPAPRCGFATSTLITRLYNSESFMLKMASVASSGEEYSMYAKPRIEPSAMVS